jgi:predicted RNase H-like nuclease (RuvC/YqgF family)
MERTLADLQEISLVYATMEKEYRAALQQNFRLERLLQEEKFKVQDLKSQLNFKDVTL